MNRFCVLTCAIGFAALVSAPAKADFSVIRWNGSHFCQVWDNNLPGAPFPADYTVVAEKIPSWGETWKTLDALVMSRKCGW